MKKIYYFPGLISAVIIPLLFWYYGNQKFEEVNFNVIDIVLPAKAKEGEKIAYLSFEPYRNWKYKKIKVAPNKARENTKFYVAEIKNLQKRNEKNSGIEFILDDSNTYNDLVSLRNDLELAGQLTYALDVEKTGHFFAVHFYKDPNEMDRANDNVGPDPYYKERETMNFSNPENVIKHLPKQAIYILFGFLFLLNISMFSIKERFQVHY